MNPTMNLRFVERDEMVPHPQIKDIRYIKTFKVLQQKFEEMDAKTGEIKSQWRDVPLAKEE